MTKKNLYSKKYFFLAFIIFISGCGSHSDTDCSDFLANNHSIIDDFSVELKSLDSSETFASTENSWLYLTSTTHIANIGITSSLTQKRTKPYFSLFKNAYATSCVPPAIKEEMVYINIFSNADYSNDFPAGSSLNTLFYSKLNLTLEEHIYYSELYSYSGIDLFIKEMPTLDKNHTFTIEIELDNGEQFTVISSVVEFQ